MLCLQPPILLLNLFRVLRAPTFVVDVLMGLNTPSRALTHLVLAGDHGCSAHLLSSGVYQGLLSLIVVLIMSHCGLYPCSFQRLHFLVLVLIYFFLFPFLLIFILYSQELLAVPGITNSITLMLKHKSCPDGAQYMLDTGDLNLWLYTCNQRTKKL